MSSFTEKSNERELLIQLRLGHEDAFRSLYLRYSRLIYGNILRLVRNEAVADDLLQDVFVKIWEHRAHINPDLSFQAYLITCSKHFAYNFKRRLKLEMEAAVQLATTYVHAEDAVNNRLLAKETKLLLEEAVNQLPAQRQRVFRLCKFDEMSYQEVADIMGITTSTVRDHMVKANKFVKSWLTQESGRALIWLACCILLEK